MPSVATVGRGVDEHSERETWHMTKRRVLTPEQRRALVNAPFPAVNVHKGRTHGGRGGYVHHNGHDRWHYLPLPRLDQLDREVQDDWKKGGHNG